MRPRPPRSSRLLASPALALVLCALAAGCTTTRQTDTTGSLGSTAAGQTETQRELAALAARYRATPQDPEAARHYARALRANDQRAQASAVLQQASIQHPHHHGLLGDYGRSLADVGSHSQALEVLNRAHTPEQPDWRILSAQGAVLDQLGRHDDAQRHYASALKIVPDEPSVLSNLGLSYALSKDLGRAETMLRRAAARPAPDVRVRQNLALVVGLQGRFAEAESIAQADLPPGEAAANVAYLRQMIAQQAGASPPAEPPAARLSVPASRRSAAAGLSRGR
jgi:Flp pilus assembly protein TadD